jgi:hypothetical protein
METAGGEDASKPTNAKVGWKELPLLFKTLKKVYDVMHADYTKSGHHEPDAMQYTERARKAVGVKSTITALNAYYFFVLAWCHGDVMKSFNAFLDVKFVGEVVTSPPKSSAKKQKTDDFQAMIQSSTMHTSVMDDRLKHNSMLKGLENRVNRLQQSIKTMGNRKVKMIRELAKMSRVKPKYRDELHQSSVKALNDEAAKIEIEINEMKLCLVEAEAELNVVYKRAENNSSKRLQDIGAVSFTTPASSHNASSHNSNDSLLEVGGLKVTGCTSPYPDSDDDEEFVTNNNDDELSDGDNDGKLPATK